MRPTAALLLVLPLAAQAPAPLSLERLYHPTRKVAYLEPAPMRLSWLPDGALLETRPERTTGEVQLARIDPATWKRSPLLPASRVLEALRAAGAGEAAAKAALGRGAFTWNPDQSGFLVTLEEDLFHVDLKAMSARRLTRTPSAEEEATYSPDGSRVAFLRGNDLHVVEVDSARETPLTTGGDAGRLNGRLDWVYQEEVYGRGSYRAFWWAPDSRRLAYLSLDVSKVPTYTLTDDRTQPQRVIQKKYPKAGDPNPIARLAVVDLQGRSTFMEDPYDGAETLAVQVGWDPKGRLLAAWQDRIQTWLELRVYEGSASCVLLKETSPAWQERLPLPRFLKDGGFLWESDRTGFRHLYRYDAEGRLLGALTEGAWDVRSLHGVDETKGLVYFSATERSPIGLDAYVAELSGKRPNLGLRRLTQAPGTHAVTFNPAFTAALDRWSDAVTPARLYLLDRAGQVERILHDEATDAFRGLRLGRTRLQQVKTRDGFPMESLLVLPPDFDPSKRYPVVEEVYGGPHAPTVRDAFGRDTLYRHFLAQQGYVVWVCDNRSASFKGAASAHGVYKRLGVQELQDLEDGLDWLKAQGWADMDRVALEGYSYGGFMTGYAMTHSTRWKLGIIGAPVTDYRLYDSVYTERFMALPKDNPAGYEGTSLMKAAGQLKGKVLMVHGTLDDNVHPQNSLQLLDAFQKAGHFPLMLLMPGSDHSPRASQHVFARASAMWDFLSRNL
jgi:dipeptidyl-peptidase-4